MTNSTVLSKKIYSDHVCTVYPVSEVENMAGGLTRACGLDSTNFSKMYNLKVCRQSGSMVFSGKYDRLTLINLRACARELLAMDFELERQLRKSVSVDKQECEVD